jgi:hypothetical protein
MAPEAYSKSLSPFLASHHLEQEQTVGRAVVAVHLVQTEASLDAPTEFAEGFLYGPRAESAAGHSVGDA